MADRTRQERERKNKLPRKKWKLQTNNNKFKTVPLAVKEKDNIEIDGQQLQYSEKGKILGITITRTGINEHVSHHKQSKGSTI